MAWGYSSVPWKVKTAMLVDGAVTTPKILDGAVTTAKIVNNSITTAKILDDAITAVKMGFGAGVATVIVAANNSVNKDKADYVCDGVADDVEINAAIDALPVTGGTIYFLDGTYTIINPIVIGVSNTSLIGCGRSTIIENLAGQDIAIITANGLSGIQIRDMSIIKNGPDTTATISFTTVSDSKIAGCYINGGANNSIRWSAVTNSKIVDCFVTAYSGSGLVLTAVSDRNKISLNTFSSAGVNTNGIFINGGSRNNVSDNACSSGQLNGIVLGGEDSYYNSIVDNICFSNTERGIRLQNRVLYSVINGNICEGNTQDGIHSDGMPGTHSNIISDNVCEGNGGDGIEIATSDSTIVADNKCIGNTGWGVNISNAAAGANLVHGNILTGNTAGSLQDNGTGTVTEDNIV